MTLWASRDEHRPEIIGVQCTYGPITFKVEEHEGHVGVFWSELGRLLAANPAHAEARAHQAYNRYREHASGKSVHGEDLPIWEDADPAVQEHWIAALSG